ncbi:MAG: helix-turn-helix domain-containing protein [Gemmatimonadaceae bacterium]
MPDTSRHASTSTRTRRPPEHGSAPANPDHTKREALHAGRPRDANQALVKWVAAREGSASAAPASRPTRRRCFAATDRANSDEADAETRPVVPAGQLICAGPLVEMLNVLNKNIDVLRRLTPRSDVPDALAAVAQELATVIRAAADLDAWVTTDEAARLSNVSPSTISWRIRRGRLAAERRGHRWMIHRSQLRASDDTTPLPAYDTAPDSCPDAI